VKEKKKIVSERLNRLRYPESDADLQIKGEKIAEQISRSEIIVFDIWNVLVYAALGKEQLLSLLETILDFPGISGNKNFAEALSENQLKRLEEISMDFCIDNEYMHHMWEYACSLQKKVYLYNNSGIDDEYARQLMKKFSYDGNICGKKLPDGSLHITEKGKGKKDLLYKNVNTLGEQYRPFFSANAVTALYKQIVNLKFHSGEGKKSLFYEYGFSCGGILTCGFCQYLNELAQYKKIDKFLFVARDGNIMQKVYRRYYNEHDSSYLIFSRFASYEIIFSDFPEEYLEKNIKTRMRRKKADNSFGKILKECGLEFLEKYLLEQNLSYKEQLNDDNFEQFRHIIMEHKIEIAEKFNEAEKAARKYFLKEIEGYKRICVVDLGWRGTSISYLKYLFKDKYKWEGDVTGAMIGASHDTVTQNYIREGVINAYAFDNEIYRGIGARKCVYMPEEETICIEALFSSEDSTLLRYALGENDELIFKYGKENQNKDKIREIQKGILDYANMYVPMAKKYHLRVMPSDAYIPLDNAMRNKKYRNLIYKGYKEEPNAINGF